MLVSILQGNPKRETRWGWGGVRYLSLNFSGSAHHMEYAYVLCSHYSFEKSAKSTSPEVDCGSRECCFVEFSITKSFPSPH